MNVTESVPLSSLTTLRIGGSAKIVATCENVEDIKAAIALAHDRGLSWFMLGGGSNLLASDAGYDGVIIHMVPPAAGSGISFEPLAQDKVGESTTAGVVAIANAGVSWDSFVEACAERGLWGIENLAGIPGTVGAGPVQNIGAYGVEISDSLMWVDVLDTASLELRRLNKDECAFAYRDSRFKHDRSLIIVRVAFVLHSNGIARTSYADISARMSEGARTETPHEVAVLVRSIRAGKFPDLAMCGTAGSFFKNPVVREEAYAELQKRYPELPGFAAPGGIKVSLAWILDKALHLKGHSQGAVRLFEKQPLVLVTETGATAHDVDAFANDIIEKVFAATGISIEREVQSLVEAKKK